MQRKIHPIVVRLLTIVSLAIAPASVAPATPIIKTIYETQRLTAADGRPGDNFGNAVSISGNLAIVGAYSDEDGRGSAYIFVLDGTSWNQQAKLTPSDGAAFGSAVAISGNMALVGSPFDSTIDLDNGAVYVFTFDGTAWTQQAKLFASDGEQSSLFGLSIALSGDTAVIGSLAEAAYVFTFDWDSLERASEAHGV